MGWLHAGHTSLIERARADERDGRRLDLRQPAPVRRDGGLHAVPAQRGARPRDLRGGGRRPRVRAAGRRGLPAGLRHDRDGRRDRRAARGRGAARALRRRGDGRRDPVLAGRRRAGLLRAQGLPAGAGDPADGAGPRAADRGRRARHGPRAGRAGAVVAQRPPVARRVGRRRRSSGGRCWPGPRASRDGERDAAAVRAAMLARPRRRSRSPSPTTSRSRTRTRSRSWRRSATPVRCCRRRCGSRASA